MKSYYNIMKKVLIAGIVANAFASVVLFTLVSLDVITLELGVK
jgi:hypothetical protein